MYHDSREVLKKDSGLDGFHLARAHLNSHSDQNNSHLCFSYNFYSLAGPEMLEKKAREKCQGAAMNFYL